MDFNFIFEQILVPSALTLGIALYILLLSPFHPHLRLLRPAGRLALMGASLVPGIGLIPAAILALLDGDPTGLWIAIIATAASALALAAPASPPPTADFFRIQLWIAVGLAGALTAILMFYSTIGSEGGCHGND